jgi:DNA invertase Pin-like site-specific DNA recombinase
MNEIKKIALYGRVSTSKQEYENQLIQLREYCKKSNWEIYGEYCDTISGKQDSRPQYDRLFIDAHKKLFDGVVFWDLSRFSRSGTLFTLQKLKELDNLNIFWHSYTEPYFSSIGQFKDVIISIMATLAKIQREQISERTKAGLERVKKAGGTVGRDNIPESAINQVIEFLKMPVPPTYLEICEKVTYQTRDGKTRHITPGSITNIKHSHLKGSLLKVD